MVSLKDVSLLAAGAVLVIIVQKLYSWWSGDSQASEANAQSDASTGAGDGNTLRAESEERQQITDDAVESGADDDYEESLPEAGLSGNEDSSRQTDGEEGASEDEMLAASSNVTVEPDRRAEFDVRSVDELNVAFEQRERGDNHNLPELQEINNTKLGAEDVVERNIATDNVATFYGLEEPEVVLHAEESGQRSILENSESGSSDSGSTMDAEQANDDDSMMFPQQEVVAGPSHFENVYREVLNRLREGAEISDDFANMIRQVIAFAESDEVRQAGENAQESFDFLINRYLDDIIDVEPEHRLEAMLPTATDQHIEASHQLTHLVNSALDYYMRYFGETLHSYDVQIAVKEMLVTLQIEVREILTHCVLLRITTQNDEQMATLLNKLNSVVKRFSELVQERTLQCIQMNIEAEKTSDETKELLMVVMQVISKHFSLTLALSRRQMKRCLDEKSGELDLMVYAYFPLFSTVQPIDNSQFINSFHAHPLTHKVLVQLLSALTPNVDNTKSEALKHLTNLCKQYCSRAETSGDWMLYVKAHRLANACAALEVKEETSKLIYDIENSYYQGKHSLTFTKHQALTNEHRQQLQKFKEETQHDFSRLEELEYDLDIERSFTDYRGKTADFCEKVFEASRKCFDSFANLSKKMVESSVDVLSGSGLVSTSSFAVVGLGIAGPGGATPYSPLRCAFIAEDESDMEYVNRLAVDLHLRMNNLGETPLKGLNIQELSALEEAERSFLLSKDSSTGYSMKGVPRSVEAGENEEDGGHLVLTVDQLVSLYEEGLVASPETTANKLSALVSNSTLVYAHNEGATLYEALRDRMRSCDISNNQTVHDQQCQSMLADINRCRPFPYTEFRPSTARSAVQADVFDYPVLLASSMQRYLPLEVQYPWNILSKMCELELLTEQSLSHLKLAVAISVYINLKVMLHHQGNADRPLVAISHSESHTGHYHIRSNIYTLFVCLVDPIQSFLKSKLGGGCRETMSSLVRNFSVSRYNWLVKAEALFCTGDYQQSLNEIYAVINKEHLSSCEVFVDLVGTELKCSEDIQKAVALYCSLLCSTKQYNVATGYLSWLQQHELKFVGQCEWRIAAALCLEEAGETKSAYNALDNVLSILKGHIKVKPNENLLHHVLEQVKHQPNLSEGLITVSELAVTTFGCLAQICGKLKEEKESRNYHKMCLKLLHKLLEKNPASKSRLWELQSFLSTISQNVFGGEGGDKPSYFNELADMYSKEPDKRAEARACEKVAERCSNMGQHEKAAKYYQKTLEALKVVHGEHANHAEIARIYNQLGLAYSNMNSYSDSLKHHMKSLEMYRVCYGANATHSHIAAVCTNVGSAYTNLDKYKEASEYHTKAIDMKIVLYGQDADHSELAKSYHQLGWMYKRMGAHEKALEYYTKSLNMFKKVYASCHHQYIAISYDSIGDLFNNMDKYTEALDYHSKSAEMWKALYGADANHSKIATSCNNIGRVYYNMGDYTKALEYHSKSLEMRKALYGVDTNHSDIATSYNNIGNVYNNMGDYTKALEYHSKSLEMSRALYGADTNHSEIATSYNNIGNVYYNMDDYTKALEYHSKSLEMRKALHGADANHSEIATSYNNIGNVYYNMGDYTKAFEYLSKSLEIGKALYGADVNHSAIASSYNNIGNVYDNMGDYTKALEYHSKPLEMRKALYGADANHSEIATSYNNIGNVYYNMGDYTKALEYHSKSLEMRRALYGADANHSDIATSYNNIGLVCYDMGDYTKALEYYSKSLEMRRALYGADANHSDIATSYNNIGLVCYDMGDYTKALEYHSKSLEMRRVLYGVDTNHSDIATSYNNIGLVCYDMGDYTKALEYHSKSLEMSRALYGADTNHSEIATSYNNIGNVYYDMGDYTKALEYHSKSLEMVRALYGVDTVHPYIAISYSHLGIVYKGMKQYSLAHKYHTKALAMRKAIYSSGSKSLDLAISYCYIGELYSELKDYVTAYKFGSLALSTLPPGNVMRSIRIFSLLAECCLRSGQYRRSWVHLHSALSLCSSFSSCNQKKFFTAKVHYLIGLLLMHLGYVAMSLEHSERALGLCNHLLLDRENTTPRYQKLYDEVRVQVDVLHLVKVCQYKFSSV